MLPQIRERAPSSYSKYIEPFVGGAAVLFDVVSRDSSRKTVANDYNFELVNFYTQVQEAPDVVFELFSNLRNDPDEFYRIRALDREPDWYMVNPCHKAARFLYLNRTCFNGLYRVNSDGYFNVPYGKIKNVSVDVTCLEEFSRATRNVEFRHGDFAPIVDAAGPDDFVYLDPPYVPISATAAFTDYTADGFSDVDQVRLRDACRRLSERGGKFLLSNSDCGRVRELYDGFTVETVEVNRLVSAKSSSRGRITEVLVRNY